MKDSTQGALRSKKFIAFAIATLGWNVLLAMAIRQYAVLDGFATMVLASMIVTQGVVQVGYIVGQAGLDALKALFDTITPDSWFGKGKKPPTPGE